MTFHNIFSKKKTPLRSNSSITKIVIDIHEKNSLVPSYLSSLNTPFEFQSLKVSDYLINTLAIERKTFHDLQSSIINKRIFSQIKDLKQYPSRLLIIEGFPDNNENNKENLILHENAIRGFLLSLSQNEKIPYLLTSDEKDTALYLSLLARKKPLQEPSLRPSKLPFSRKEQALFILEGFPGIGPLTAKKLLAHFHSLGSVFVASEEQLRKIIGKKALNFYQLTHENF